MGKKFHRRNTRGIALVELALFIMCSGLMMVAATPIYHTYIVHKYLDVTNNNIAATKAALDSYYLRNGHFPCAAPRNVPVDGPGFGVAAADCSVPQPGTVEVSGRTPKDDTSGTGASAKIRIGAVPVRTLGLPDGMAVDGWNHLFTYAITESYTTAPKDLSHGAIYVVDSKNNPATAVPGIAVYVVAGANPDGTGAYNLNGTLLAPCPPTKAGTTGNNCNDKGVFLSSTLQANQGVRAVENAIALAATACSPKTSTTGNLGNISFFVDNSGSMNSRDITSTGGNISRMEAAKAALATVVPQVIDTKASHDPTNIVGVNDFGTFNSRYGSHSTKNCDGLTGNKASQCLFNAFPPNTVDSVIGGSISSSSSGTTAPVTVSTTDYTNASASLVNNVNSMAPTGNTPLYDSMVALADGVEGTTGTGGTSKKPDDLIIVSDGEDNSSRNNVDQMIDTISTKYPNIKIDFVFVGTPRDGDKVNAAVYKTTKAGHKLNGSFIQVQNAASIMNSMTSLVSSGCGQ